MDRKGIIAVVLSLIVLVGWQYKMQKDAHDWAVAHPEAVAAARVAASPAASVAPVATSSGSGRSAENHSSGNSSAAPESAVPEQKQVVSTPSVKYTFTNHGGGIATVDLLKHEGEKAGETIVLNAFGSHPIGALLQEPAKQGDDSYAVSIKDGQVLAERNGADGVKITKTFSLPQDGDAKKKPSADEYTVPLDVAFTNTGGAPVDYPAYYVFVGSAEPIHQADLPMYTDFAWYKDSNITLIDPNWFSAKKMPIVGVETAPAQSNYFQAPGGIVWAGVKSQYFTSLITTPDAQAAGVWADRLDISTELKTVKGIEGALGMPGFKIAPGETVHLKFTVYAGPKEFRRLQQLGHGEQDLMNFGSSLGPFGFLKAIVKPVSINLLRTMNWLHDYTGSYAVAIIILTFVVRGALWPIQGAATKSMKRMQLLTPKMNELKEKYKDDPTRMNNEVMKLYKDYKINPLAGCLPAFIQIPIFMGFYSMLGTAVELRNSHFLWVHDLSQPDTIFHIGTIAVNILPLCMAATMVFQMSLTPKTGDPAQQKMFMFMPLVFVFFTYNFASALALYYTVQNILSIVQLYVTRNQAPPTLDLPSISKKSKKSGR